MGSDPLGLGPYKNKEMKIAVIGAEGLVSRACICGSAIPTVTSILST